MAAIDDLKGSKKPAPPQAAQGVDNFQPPPAEAWGDGNPNTMGDWMANNLTGTIKKIEPQPLDTPTPQPVPLKNTETAAEAAARQPFKPQSMQDIVNHLGRPKELTPEELAREQKRETTRARIRAVADAISAIGEMSAVSQGAVPSTPLNLSGTAMKRYEQRLAERKAEQDAYRGKLMQASMTDLANQQKVYLEREQRAHEAEREELAWKRKAEEAAQNRDWEARQNALKQAAAAQARKEEFEFRSKESDKDRAVQWGRINASGNKPAPVDKRPAQVQAYNSRIDWNTKEIERLKKEGARTNADRIKTLQDDNARAQRDLYVIQNQMNSEQAQQPTTGGTTSQAAAVGDDDEDFSQFFIPSGQQPYDLNT